LEIFSAPTLFAVAAYDNVTAIPSAIFSSVLELK
jgi:hypothetical protein